ncbi:MAG: AEC family transporter [Clostridia bacterium]
MENLLLSINVVFPLLVLLICGFLLRKWNFINDEVNDKMNKLVSQVFLPFLVFNNIYSCNSTEILNSKVMLLVFFGILFEFAAAFVYVKFFEKDTKKKGVIMQGMFRSNFVIFGLPIAISIYGDEGGAYSAVLTMLAVPMYNFLAVIALEIFASGNVNIKELSKKVLTNTLILGSIAGILFSLLHIQIPDMLYEPISSISGMVTPLAFILLGSSLKLSSTALHKKQLIISVVVRLVVFPAILLFIAIKLGFTGVWLVALLALFASPTAVSSFPLTKAIGGDSDLAGNIVVFTTTLSVVTMFVWVYIFNLLNLI